MDAPNHPANRRDRPAPTWLSIILTVVIVGSLLLWDTFELINLANKNSGSGSDNQSLTTPVIRMSGLFGGFTDFQNATSTIMPGVTLNGSLSTG